MILLGCRFFYFHFIRHNDLESTSHDAMNILTKFQVEHYAFDAETLRDLVTWASASNWIFASVQSPSCIV